MCIIGPEPLSFQQMHITLHSLGDIALWVCQHTVPIHVRGGIVSDDSTANICTSPVCTLAQATLDSVTCEISGF